ncbi:hypothetical protein A3N52_13745 [Klebsiella aerogenes]|nr:hypothetical protein A3N42_05525 [Klebsiella aerogenes]KZQ26868.1 hypothetical protein A3N45_19440 [Klebsiella aerogenes]KZQ60385.1 hypothetical protein A3N50_06635 [Klebsiella aerogenes]KZQ80432.1 hypothetical protein A3N52_13745 [Klebsiella aerogenes]
MLSAVPLKVATTRDVPTGQLLKSSAVLCQDDSGTTLNNGAQKSVQVDESSQSARFPLQVRALSVNGGATQGTIQAVISVTYTYA